MNTKKTNAQKLAEQFGRLLVVMFFYPWVVMKGWEAIAWEFNLPLFDYWACFFITHGFRYLLPNLNKRNG
jgi:hypothetical protein